MAGDKVIILNPSSLTASGPGGWMYRETRQPWRWFDLGTHTLNKHLLYNLGAKVPIYIYIFLDTSPLTPVPSRPPLAHRSAHFLQGSLCVSVACTVLVLA